MLIPPYAHRTDRVSATPSPAPAACAVAHHDNDQTGEHGQPYRHDRDGGCERGFHLPRLLASVGRRRHAASRRVCPPSFHVSYTA
eukprot:2878487-Rhodomonas_salina.1